MDPKPLDDLVLSYPCPVNWAMMKGDERERFCKQCSKTVFNISELSTAEANEFLQEKTDSNLCVKFYKRADGTIKTDNCPKIFRPVRNTVKLLLETVSVASGLLLLAVSNLFPAGAQPKPSPYPAESPNPFGSPISSRKDAPSSVSAPIFMGKICPSETKSTLDLLLNLKPTNSEEKELLDKLRQQKIQRNSIFFKDLQELEAYYSKGKNTDPDRVFLSKLLEINLQIDNHEYIPKAEELSSLENLQLQATDFLASLAQKQLKLMDIQEAERTVNYCIELGKCGLYWGQTNVQYTKSHKRVSFPNHQAKVLMRESTLTTVLSILNKTDKYSIYPKSKP